MGKDYYYNAFTDDDGDVASTLLKDAEILAKAIDPHLLAKMILGWLSAFSVLAMITYVLFQIEMGKKIKETNANMPDDMKLNVEKPASDKGGTVAVIVNASVVKIPEMADSDVGRMDRKSPRASAMESLETSKMLELLGIAVAITLMVLLLLVFVPLGSLLLNVVGMMAVTCGFLKDHLKSEWRKERFDRMLALATLIVLMASSLSLLTYATMGISEGFIYAGPARIVGHDESKYTNAEDETITRVDLQVSWGGPWGCPRMDKTCYDKVEGALCEEKEYRKLRELTQSQTITLLDTPNDATVRGLEEVEEVSEDDEVYDDDKGGKEVVENSEYKDSEGTIDEEVYTEYSPDGKKEDEFIDIEEVNNDGSEVDLDEQVYYSADGNVTEIAIEEYQENADGSDEVIVDELEYEKVNGEEELVEEDEFEENGDGSIEDTDIDLTYKSTPTGNELNEEEVVDEKVDADGNASTKDTKYENVNGTMEEVSEDDDTTEDSKDIAPPDDYDDAHDDHDDADDLDDDSDDENDDVAVLKEELKEANKENKELKNEIDEENEEIEDEEEEIEEEEEVEEEEEEEINELEDEVNELYQFEDDFYEDEYWSATDWDAQWGDYQCDQLFDTEYKKLPAYDASTPPGDDEWPFVSIYGKCNTCDAYLVDYFSSEHFNNIKKYQTQTKSYGVAGLCGVVITGALVYWQKKRPGQERMLGLIPNENSNVV